MTTAQLIARTFERLQETTASARHYGAAEVLQALNWAQQMFVFLALPLEARGTLALTANQTFFDPTGTFTDYIAPLRIRITGLGGQRLDPATVGELRGLSTTWRADTGVPLRYLQLGAALFAIHPHPSAGGTSIEVTYAKSPAVMTDASTPEIPLESHPALIDGAIVIVRAKEGGAEFENVKVNLTRYFDEIERAGNHVRARSIAEGYDTLPFELKRFDRSRLMARPKAAK